MDNNIMGNHSKLKMINEDIELYKNMSRYKDMLSNIRHGIEYMVSYMAKLYTPEVIYDDLYLKIEALRTKGFLDRRAASVYHNLRRLANSYGSHLDLEATEEIASAYYPYMNEVISFMDKYGNGANVVSSEQEKTNILSPAILYTTCRNGMDDAKKEFEGKKIKVSGNIGKVFDSHFNLEGIAEGKKVFISVDGLQNMSLEEGSSYCVFGEWYAPTIASLNFGNAGRLKEMNE